MQEASFYVYRFSLIMNLFKKIDDY